MSPPSSNPTTEASLGDLKALDIEELMDLEVTSASRRPERFADTASAMQIITREEIRRSGAVTLVQALRLASNLEVAQVNASQWAVSARGFNNVLANKLLVMIDGRSIYTPFYAGVFWDANDVLLEDVEQIEVVSGPGGAVWGANAVNGVINIITRKAVDTVGTYVELGGGGTQLLAGARHGGKLTPNLAYRVQAKHLGQDDTLLVDGRESGDAWSSTHGAFRLDWDPKARDLVTLQGDLYDGDPNPDGTVANEIGGGNLLGRWQRVFANGSHLQLQTYYDRATRDFNNGLAEGLTTMDVELQHTLQPSARQEILYGFGLRWMDHSVNNLPGFEFLPARRELRLYSAFVEDEIALVPGRWRLALGSKFEHNTYTGLEIQPSFRLAFTPSRRQTIWSALSRAVRTPSRLDRDFRLSFAPNLPVLVGNPRFESEKLLAYELGWRMSSHQVSVSAAAFYNQYDDLRSAEPGPPPLGLPITIANGVRGDTYGLELAAEYEWTERLRLRGGYVRLEKRLELKPGSRDLNAASAESDDPRDQFLLQATADLPGRLQLDFSARYVDDLPLPHVPSYFGLDVRFAWSATERLMVEIVGQNLLDDRHLEFLPTSPSPREIRRSFYLKLACRF